jgi:hypothetical protein
MKTIGRGGIGGAVGPVGGADNAEGANFLALRHSTRRRSHRIEHVGIVVVEGRQDRDSRRQTTISMACKTGTRYRHVRCSFHLREWMEITMQESPSRTKAKKYSA